MNDFLYQEAKRYVEEVYLGSENDVLDRYYQAARVARADIIMRITGDCPLISPELCGAVLEKFKSHNALYASNIEPRTFPRGLDCEVFRMEILEGTHAQATDPYDREHVTSWMRKWPKQRVNVASPWPIEGRLCLDTEDDYKVICAHFGHEPYQHLSAA